MLRDDHAMWYGLDRDVSKLKFGPGSNLWKYWTKGKGLAKWGPSPHKWSTLNKLLKEHVPMHMVDGLTTNMVNAVFPGYMKKHKHDKGD